MHRAIAPEDPATRRQWVLDHDPVVTRGELLHTLNQIADWPLRVGPATVLAAHGLTDLADTLRTLPPAGGLMEERLDNPAAGEELETALVAGRDAVRELLGQSGHPAWMRDLDQQSASAGISRLVASVAADVGGTHSMRTAGRAAESIILLGCNKRLFDSAEQREGFAADLDLGLRIEIASHASLVDWVPIGTRPVAESSAPPLPAEGSDDSAPASHPDRQRNRRWLVADEIFSAIEPVVAQSNLNGVLAEATADWALRVGPAEALRACRFWDEHDMVATLPTVTAEMFRQPSHLRPHVRALKRAALALEEREIDLSHAGIHHDEVYQRLGPTGQASSLAVKADLLARTPSSKAGYWAYRLLCSALTVTELDPTTSNDRLRQGLEQAVKRIWFTGIPDMEWLVKLDVLVDIDPDTDAQTCA